jgi:hypothetical protein
MRHARLFSLVILAPLATACTAGSSVPPGSTGSGGEAATSASSGGGGSTATTTTTDGVGGGIQGSDPCGNGLDDDQNGEVDDGCSCSPGATQPCFAGDPANAGVGACALGAQTCVSLPDSELGLGEWDECLGSIAPSDELCGDGVDNDCDGETDEGCACPAPTVVIDGLDPLACGETTATATLTFDAPVTGVVAGDTVTISNGAVIDAIDGGPTVYTVQLSGLDDAGPYTLSVLPAGSSEHIAAACGADLAAAAAADIAGAPADAPTVAITMDAVPCGVAEWQATLTFSAPVTGVVANDTVVASGGATITSVQGGPAVYTVGLGNLAMGGSYGVSVVPVGSASTIASASCATPLAAGDSQSFDESGLDVALSISPGPVFSFGDVAIGMTAEQTFTVTPAGGGVAGAVVPSLNGSFKWKGGAYPGAGGTCGASIAAPCTLVVTYSPASLCTETTALSLSYAACAGTASTSTLLTGHGDAGAAPTTCATTQVLYVSPSGNDGNSGLAPNLPKKTLAGALAISIDGAEIRAAEGVYGEILQVSGCRKLFGGYDATFQTRDPAAHESALVASAPGAAVVSFPGAALHLDGFTVQNTAPSGEALYYFQGSLVISNNVLSGADYGAYFWQHTCGAIYGNVASGAQGGLYFWQSGIAIYDNHLSGSSNAVTTWQNQGLVFSNNTLDGGVTGIQTWQESGMIFDGNRISGSASGVQGWQSNAVVYRNNYVYDGSTALSESSNGVVVANNTLASPSTGLSIQAADYVVANNAFLGVAGGATGVHGQMPSSLESNLFVGLSTLASLSGAPAIVSQAGFAALDHAPLVGLPGGCVAGVDCWTARVKGNVASAMPAATLFVSPAGADGSVASLGDNDWHLLTNDAAITQGGRDASQNDCGSYEAPRSCGQVEADVEGFARTAPYSIGAHEK